MNNLTGHNEREILASLKAGNAEAFTAVYNLYYTGIMFFAQRFVAHEKAEDILAETFIKLWQHAPSFESFSQIHKWLRVTVRNACLNQLREQKNTDKKQAALLYLSEQEYEHQYFMDKLKADLYTMVVAEIEKMYPQQRRIIKMFFLQGMDNAAIAKQLRISVQAVKNQKVTALKALRRVFAKEDIALYGYFLLLFSSSLIY